MRASKEKWEDNGPLISTPKKMKFFAKIQVVKALKVLPRAKISFYYKLQFLILIKNKCNV